MRMFNKTLIGALAVSVSLMSGCATVPMGSKADDLALKQFKLPPADKAGLYVYRDSFVGQALKKTLFLDGNQIGETANKVYFHELVAPGKHTLSTESEFSPNALNFQAEGGKNYYFEQYIKMGVFVGGANLREVDEKTGQKEVQACHLAKSMPK